MGMKTEKTLPRRTSETIILLMLALSACAPLTTDLPPTFENPPTTSPTPAPRGVEAFFTEPGSPQAADYEGGPGKILAEAIDQARLSVDMAAYSLNLWSIRDALIHAAQRGVAVRMVMESDNMDSPEVQQIEDAGIPITGDQHEGLMHNKFVVIDRSEVWTGSMNFTTSGAYRDNNNLVHLRSTQVAEVFTTAFSEMFREHLFGPGGRSKTIHDSFKIDGTQIETYFSPEDGVAAAVQNLIQGAQESINFMAFSFTANDLGDAIIQRAAEGVTVQGVMDDGQINSNQGTNFDSFLQAGLDVRRDGNPGQMHHKVIIIDKSIVITGSYNFSTSAEEQNDENLVVIHDADIAADFLAEFTRVYEQAQHP